jgi:hypothetical protein
VEDESARLRYLRVMLAWAFNPASQEPVHRRQSFLFGIPRSDDLRLGPDEGKLADADTAQFQAILLKG